MGQVMRLLDKKGKVTMDLFKGSTINTPSMLAVEDYIDALEWVAREGGLPAMIRRCKVFFLKIMIIL